MQLTSGRRGQCVLPICIDSLALGIASPSDCAGLQHLIAGRDAAHYACQVEVYEILATGATGCPRVSPSAPELSVCLRTAACLACLVVVYQRPPVGPLCSLWQVLEYRVRRWVSEGRAVLVVG